MSVLIMRFLKTVTFLTFILLTIGSTLAQDRFERFYQTNDEDFVTVHMAIRGSSYLIYSAELNEDGQVIGTNITSLDQKGSVNWSNSFLYGDSLIIRNIGEIVILEDGGIAFSALLDTIGTNKVITKIDNNGTVLWSVLGGQHTDLPTIASDRLNLLEVNGQKILSTHVVEEDDGTDLYLISTLYDGQFDWAKKMAAADTTGNALRESIRDMTVLQDSTVLLAGNLSSVSRQLFLTNITDSCDVHWSRSYTGDFGAGLSQSVMSIDQLVDGSIVLLGAQAGSTTNTFVLRVDSSGHYMRSWMLRSNDPAYELIPNKIIGLQDTTVSVAMKRLDLSSNIVQPLIIHFDLDTTVVFQTLLKEVVDGQVDRSGFVTPDSMTVAMAVSVDTNDSVIPYVIKLDEQGQTLCNESVDLVMVDSVFFYTDTLVWMTTSVEAFDSVRTISENYGGFSPPTLNLPDTFFCPQDPVIFTVDARVPGAIAYIWDDLRTDSIRTFFEEGMYSLTVTVGTDVCFELCDTTTITVREFPEAAIVQDAVNFCSTGEILLGVVSQNQIREVLWSTGETTQQIAVTELMGYSVRIIDDCGNEAEASINLSDFSRSNAPIIDRSDADICVDNTIRLSVGNIPLEDLSWSTGETDVASIVISEPGTYTASNNEQFCPGETSIVIPDDAFVPDISVNIDETCSNPIVLLISGEGIVAQEWNDGSTRPFLNVTEPGTYTVTVFDACGDSETASIDISEDRVLECIPPPQGVECLQWPNAFIPSSNEENNQTFGPKNDCVILQDYELRIYNRWGKNIFTSNNVDARWNGRVNGDNAPPDVYFWWAKYSDGSTTFQDEGDVTLIR